MSRTTKTTALWLHGLWLAALLALAVGATGCTAIAGRRLSGVEREMVLLDGDAALFRQCLESRGGTCPGNASTALPQSAPGAGRVAPLHTALSAPVDTAVAALGPGHPAQAARAVLSHPFLQKVTAVHNHLRGLPPAKPVNGVEAASTGAAEVPETTLTLSTSPEEVGDFADRINQATASGAWRALSEQTGKHAALLGESAGETDQAVRQDARTAAFLRRYMEAYFENGRFLKVDLDTQDLDRKINGYLSRNASLFCDSQTSPCAALTSSLQNEILKGVAKDPSNQDFVLLALGTQGYVSRLGDLSLSFPGVQVTLDPAGARPASVTKIDPTKVGTDLVWVFFQALFDAHEGLPAVSNATGLDLGAAGKAFDLPVLDPEAGNVDRQDLSDIITFSNQVSGTVGAAFDRVIRGLGPFSLNNEALEELLTAIVSATVHNATQKAAWCWFSCNLDQKIEKATDREKEKVRAELAKSAKRIKLRLRVL
ncbi:MAG TPA: hypothetical protein VJ725_25790 [Thermoanaerobaculia bacterium]|nr:hypothetical protein [Thermoanaerobaculia bacterium]